MDPARLGLAEAARLVRTGELSAERYAAGLLERIEQHAALNAFITVRPEQLLEDARRADRAVLRGEKLGPLHGVPVAVKDNIDTADLATTAGTPALRNHHPKADAECVRRLRRAGALVLGKTNLHELAYGLTSDNAYFGAVGNPYDPGRIAGGSSGGTACAVAAGLVAGGLGTDTGGSVRVPAALCGVAALRPTVGRYSARGLVLVSGTRDTVGPIARTVADVALLDGVLAETPNVETADVEASGAEFPGESGLAGLRLGVPSAFHDGLAPDLDRLLRRRLSELSDAGAELVDVPCPVGLDGLIARAGFPIAFRETPLELDRYLRAAGSALTVADVVGACASADVKELLAGLIGGAAIPETDYRDAIRTHRPELDRMLRQMLTEHRVEAIVWPTTPVAAAPLGSTEVELGGRAVPAFLGYTRTTNPGSIVGWPGVSVPAGLDDTGLPVGLALDAPPGADRWLLAIAAAVESLFGPLPAPGR